MGASDWLGFGGKGVGPWADHLHREPPKLLGTTEVDFEAVAALRSDLILDTRSDHDQEKRRTLSKIAPTKARRRTSIPTARRGAAGRAGRQGPRQGCRRREDRRRPGREAAANKEFDGKTTVVGAHFDGRFGAYVSGNARVDLMKRLGFTPREDVEELGAGRFYVDISAERLDLLDHSVPLFTAALGR